MTSSAVITPASEPSSSTTGRARRLYLSNSSVTLFSFSSALMEMMPCLTPVHPAAGVQTAAMSKKTGSPRYDCAGPAVLGGAAEAASHRRNDGGEAAEISVSEFFTKNRHLLGFDNPGRKALLTTVKEAVDNSPDAAQAGGDSLLIHSSWIFRLKVAPVAGKSRDAEAERSHPWSARAFSRRRRVQRLGDRQAQIPKIFAKLLYGLKFLLAQAVARPARDRRTPAGWVNGQLTMASRSSSRARRARAAVSESICGSA